MSNVKCQMSNVRLRRGSALIMALLVIAVLASVALGTGKLFVSDLTIGRSFTDTQQAFYAAQAGLEEGMRQFVVNPNREGEIPAPSLANGSVSITSSYKIANPNFGALVKDEILEIDITNVASSSTNLTINATRSAFDASTGLQIERIDSNSTTPNQEFRQGQLTQTEILPIQITTVKVRIKPIGRGLTELRVSAGTVPIDSGKTEIAATGSFGLAKRKLSVTIDRKTGTLLGMFDYALLSQNSIQ